MSEEAWEIRIQSTKMRVFWTFSANQIFFSECLNE